MARSLHVHPNVLDFWLIAVYCEFDLRGSMQASRRILLQGIRRNPGMPEFYFEYLKFELRVLQKLYTRKKLLETNEAMKGIEDVTESEKTESSKINESVPSIVYATATQSITRQFRLDVELHFRIRDLVKNFDSCVDTTQLMKSVEDHISEVLYVECKAKVMDYILKDVTEVSKVTEQVTDFLGKTLPDVTSFKALLNHLQKIEATAKDKYTIANQFYAKINETETDSVALENSATLFLQFIDVLNSSIDIDAVLTQLHQKYPTNFPILVHYCKHALLEGEFDESQVLSHRDYLSKLTNAIKEKQSTGEGKNFQLILPLNYHTYIPVPFDLSLI